MSDSQSPQSVKVDPKGSTPATPVTPGGGAAPGTASGAGTPPAQPHGPGRVKRTARQIKQAFLVIIGALIAIFAITNLDPVPVSWIFGDPVSTPLIVVIAIALVAGLAIGWLLAKLSARNSD